MLRVKDFFISYNRHDKQWAEWIAWTLEEAGKTVIVEVWDFQPGGNFVEYMNQAVQEAKQTIAVLSEHFLKANYVHPEWAAAFAKDPQGAQRKLIPVRVSECQPAGLLAQIVYVDFVGVTETEAKRRLLNGLKERAVPDEKPSFPGAVVPKAERTEPEPVAFPGTEATVESDVGSGLRLQPFEFTVVTVNAKGEQVKSEQRTARSFQEDLGYGVGLSMVSIPGGAFVMGAPKTGEAAKDSERPQHLVRVPSFFMGKYPVTQEQWFAVSELPKVNCDLDPNCSTFKGLQRPVECVSWDEAVEFCDRLSHRTGRQYRLPSEAEWEYACRAGTTTPFHFGETITTDWANCNGNDTYGAGPKGESRKQTTDVGTFPPNAFGLYDMHGNVWEWCLDHKHANYQGAPTDGSAWATGGDSERRVIRGGSWGSDLGLCRSAHRDGYPSGYRVNYIGFRVVCSAPGPPSLFNY